MTAPAISSERWKKVAEFHRFRAEIRHENPAMTECHRVAAEHAEKMAREAEKRKACERGEHVWCGKYGPGRYYECCAFCGIDRSPAPAVTKEDVERFIGHYESLLRGELFAVKMDDHTRFKVWSEIARRTFKDLLP